jgi:transcription elongation factor GreA
MAYFTEKALKKLKQEISYLERVERKKIQERLKKTIAFGDLAENAAYTSVREDQELLEKKIDELKRDSRNAIIVKSNTNSTIQLSSVVYLEKTIINNKSCDNCNKLKVVLSSPNEANPLQNEISTDSPLGRALFGKKKGDVFSIKIDKKTIKYKIIEIK